MPESPPFGAELVVDGLPVSPVVAFGAPWVAPAPSTRPSGSGGWHPMNEKAAISDKAMSIFRMTPLYLFLIVLKN
jgi:hypothetical protein